MLEAPAEVGEVQEAFNLAHEGSVNSKFAENIAENATGVSV